MKFIIGFNLIEAYYVGTEVIKMKRIPIQEAISEAGLKKKYVAECLGIIIFSKFNLILVFLSEYIFLIVGSKLKVRVALSL